MTSPPAGSTDGARADHIDIDELADASVGLVDEDRGRVIETHLAGCSRCRSDADALAGVQQTLRSQPAEAMPGDVFARLQSVVVTEQQGRTERRSEDSGESGARPEVRSPAKPPLADRFSDLTGQNSSPGALRAKFAGGALAATLLAGSAGFGGYVASAAAGTAEPPADHPAVVSASGFAESAAEVRSTDPKSYTFTQAWSCARAVTNGKITGIKATVLNGRSGYLVLLSGENKDSAVFISGCDTPNPTSGPSATLPKR